MDLRGFLADLEKTGDLLNHSGGNPDVEIASMIFKENKPILFDGIGDYRLVSGICMDRELIARYMGIKKEELLFRIADALDKPVEPAGIAAALKGLLVKE